jgi:hypothetical protein
MHNDHPSHKITRYWLLTLLMFFLLGGGILVIAQGDAPESDPPPVAYTPGVPLRVLTATQSPDACYAPLSIETGDLIYIKPGVIIRNQPSRNGALVWNTIYDSRDEDGRVEDTPLAVPATVVEGPICAQAFNWWRVTGTGNPGWVAEGRPDQGGYNLIVLESNEVQACPALNDLMVGDVADLRYNVRIRENPSLLGRTKTIAPAGTPINIVGGAQCVDGIVWWGVQATVADFTYSGWMAQGFGDEDGEEDYLLPEDAPSLEDGTLCAPPLLFSAGDRGYVNYRNGGAKALRTAPGSNNTLLFSLVDGVPFTIVSGPVCRENLNWWQITVQAGAPVTGWMAEGSPGQGVGYWMSRLDPQP